MVLSHTSEASSSQLCDSTLSLKNLSMLLPFPDASSNSSLQCQNIYSVEGITRCPEKGKFMFGRRNTGEDNWVLTYTPSTTHYKPE